MCLDCLKDTKGNVTEVGHEVRGGLMDFVGVGNPA